MSRIWLAFFIVFIICIILFYRKKYYSQRIPKIIIQTWKTATLPPKYLRDTDSVKIHHPDYEYIFFADDDIENFLEKHYPEYYVTYNKLPLKIQKVDFFRYVAVYHYGGFYLDLDIFVHKPFDDLLHYSSVFPIDLHLNENMCKDIRFKDLCERKQKIMVGQYAFGAEPKHPFIKSLIDAIHANIDTYIQRYQDDKSLNYVYKTTGPDFVTEMYLDSKEKDKIKILYHKKGQYFGEYAQHNHYGTWK